MEVPFIYRFDALDCDGNVEEMTVGHTFRCDALEAEDVMKALNNRDLSNLPLPLGKYPIYDIRSAFGDFRLDDIGMATSIESEALCGCAKFVALERGNLVNEWRFCCGN